MADAVDTMIDAAIAEGRRRLDKDPRALNVHFDRIADRVVIELVDVCAYAFPPRLVQDLQHASADDLAVVKVDGAGFNLHWPTLDVDLYVPALVAGIFGTRAWMTRELARVAGQSTSPARPPPLDSTVRRPVVHVRARQTDPRSPANPPSPR